MQLFIAPEACSLAPRIISRDVAVPLPLVPRAVLIDAQPEEAA